MASSALLLPYPSPKTLISSKTQPQASLILPSSLSFASGARLRTPHLSSVLLPKHATIFSSGFVRNVLVSSEFEQGEVSGAEEERASFSPDLKLFVGNLPFSVDSSVLAGLFERAGNVEMVEVIYDKLTGRSRGFGFVTMSTVEEVEAAEQQFNGYELEGRPLRVNAGPPPRRDESRGFRGGGGGGGSSSTLGSSHRVHVGNLPWNVDESALESLFSEQGNVVEARVIYDRDSGRSRGFGFVTYDTADEVNNAISSLDGMEMNGRSIRVTMAESRPRRQF